MTPLVWFRALRPDDGELLDQIMDGMSAQSRYQRYHGPKPRLTSADRRYLTSVDERNHLALVALAPEGDPVGVVRAVRLKDDPLAAEVGIEVVDAWQNQGVGTTLIARIARRAAAAGIERLVARVLDETGYGRSLMRRGWSVVGRDGPSVILGADAWALARAGASAPAVVRGSSPVAPPSTAAG
jgi:GNAT superfamily N-acetyltransferase